MDFYSISRLISSNGKLSLDAQMKTAIVKLYNNFGQPVDSNFVSCGQTFELSVVSNETLNEFCQGISQIAPDEAGNCGAFPCSGCNETPPAEFGSSLSFALGTNDLSHITTMSQRRVFRDGYCYMNIFIAMAPFIFEENVDVYCQFLNDCPLVLGEWPKLPKLGRAMLWLSQRAPNVLNKIIPGVSVSHDIGACHIADQRGPIVGWHIADIVTYSDLLRASISKDTKNYIVGGEIVLNSAYKNLSQAIKDSNRTRQPWITFNKKLQEDSLLAATLIMSPATLLKLQHWFDDKHGFARMVAGLESSVADALTRSIVIKRAIEGVTLHFDANRYETCAVDLHRKLTTYLETNDNGSELQVAASKMANLICEKKDQYLYFEKQIHSVSDCRWRRAHDFGFISIGEGFFMLLMHMLNDTLPHVSKLEAKERFLEMALFWRFIWCSIYGVLQALAMMMFGWFTVKNLMLATLRFTARYYIGQQHKHVIWTVLVTTIATLVTIHAYLKTIRVTKLQGKENDKRVTGIMAMVILLVHVFDVDLALALSSSLNNVSRLSQMLTEETSGLLPRLIGGRLQALNDHEIAEIDLELDPEEIKNETLIQSSMTFGSWLDSKIVAFESYTRELQYGGKDVNFIVTPHNHETLVDDMISTKRSWNSVIGGTGSGKSTRVPVHYIQKLRTIAGRNHRILVCEPSRATVANVAAGISHFLGEQVYFKHRTKEQAGNMCVQVMTYGSALMRSVRDPNFLQTFDAVFLDESHIISEHGLTLESLLDRYRNVRKFYMSATPRVGPFETNGHRRFQIQRVDVENSDPNFWLKEQGKGSAYDVTNKGPVVLCFVQGRKQADNLAAKINNSNITSDDNKFKGYSLHSDNFDVAYNSVIKASNEGEYCFIFCTNILETGVTLNADCVVDFGQTMRPELNIMNKTLRLVSSRVTQFERHQRIGRVGRVKDGFALCCGRVVTGRPPVSPEVVYGAALYAFVYDLELYADTSLDTSWLGGITKKQAEVILSFDLPMFVTRDLIGRDGAMQKEMISCLKENLLFDTQIMARNVQVAADRWQSWPRAHDLILSMNHGDVPEALENLKHERVPFIDFHLNSLDLAKFITACKSYEPRISYKVAPIGNPTRKVLMRIDPDNINQCHQVAVCLKEHCKSMLDSLVTTRGKVQESKLLNCFPASKRLLDDQSKRINAMRRNIEAVNTHIQKLESYDSFVREDNMPENFDMAEFTKVYQHMDLQMHGTNSKNELKKVLEITSGDDIKVSDVLLHHGDKIALSMVALSGAYLLSSVIHAFRSVKPADELYTLEGKGKPYSRSKRSEAAAVNNAFDMFEDIKERKVRKTKGQHIERPNVISNLLKKTNPFVNFYDIGDDSNVEHAVFKTLEGEIIHETKTPINDIASLPELIIDSRADVAVKNWADEAEAESPERIQCFLTLKDGREVKVDMSKHQSRRITRTAGLMGYENKEGEYRQTGSTKLEISTTMPLTRVNADVSDMIGTVASRGKARLNAILYGDFIILPGHVQMLDFPLTIRFKHASCIVQQLPIMSFKMCDLVLARRPNSIAPVRVHAKCAAMSGTPFVQLVYRDLGTFTSRVSASDTATPFDNGRWSYSISTKDGMCGAAVVNLKDGTFVGIHVSANERLMRNFMEPLSESMVDVLQKKAPIDTSLEWKFDHVACGYGVNELDALQSYNWDLEFDPARYSIDNLRRSASGWGLIQNFHKIEPSEKPLTFSLSNGGFEILAKSTSNLCSKHKIIGESTYWKEFKAMCPDLVEGIEEYEDAYCPSALTREAYYKDISKYDRSLACEADLVTLEKAREMVKEDLRRAGLTSTRMMSASEVLGDLDPNTAAGALYACKKKVLFLGWDDDKLLTFANECFSNLRDGTAAGVWNGSLKDELRPIEKVLESKTRVFTAAPVTTLVGGKFVVDDFNKQFYTTNLKARHTVGINPWAGGWERLKTFLGGSNMPFYVSGDGSRFDSSLDPILFDQVLKLRMSLMANKNGEHEALKNLYHEIVFTPILLENGQIVMKKVGNNSGQPSTVVDNTLILMMCFYYCSLRVTDDEEWIRKNFLFVCNGDDQKCAMTQDFIDKGCFNFEDKLRECGLNYEFDDLTDDIEKYPYMSLTMVKNGDRTGFMLDQRRIVAINQWMNKKGILGVAQRAFPAMLHSYNDPWLFTIMHAYLVWLLMSYEDEILYAMSVTGERVSYLTPDCVDLLHFGGTRLQIDSEDEVEQKKKEEERQRAEAPKANEHVNRNTDTEIVGVAWAMPNLRQSGKSMGFRNIKGHMRIQPSHLKNIPRNVTELMRNDVATDNQFVLWETEVRNDYDITSDAAWNTTLMAWLLFCANNGTTNKFNPLDVIPIPNGHGGTDDIQIGGFIRASNKVGLRKLMRKLSRETSQMLLELGQMTKWGLTHGLNDRSMIPYAFDFYAFDEMTPAWVREQLSGVKHSALGRGTVDALLLDAKHHDSQVVTRSRNDQKSNFQAPAV